MRSKANFEMGLRKAWSPYSLTFKCFILIAFVFAASLNQLQAQGEPQSNEEVEYILPSWWFGIAGGANANFYRGSTHKLNSETTIPATFHDGFGLGLYAGPLVEFHRPESRWGVMLQAGYDSRKGAFDKILTPCNCPADLTTDLSYISFEPSLRFQPFKKNLYLFAGPRFAYNLDKSFMYQQYANPNYPDQVDNPEVNGDFSDVNPFLVSMQVGAGYDIHLSSKMNKTKWVLSPFVSFQPYFGQDPRSIETWNITTLRAGAAIKLGFGSPKSAPSLAGGEKKEVIIVKKDEEKDKEVVLAKDSDVKFTIKSPKNVPTAVKVKEIFPLRNYIFFDLGSTEIPDRYVLLKKSQVAEFKEEQVELFPPKNLSGRSDRQMIVYYNVLNILGDRMVRNPGTTVSLVGSSEKGPEDAKLMAESVKTYLVTIFGINANRISVDGRYKPIIPSEKPGSTTDLELRRAGDRRVTIESNSPALLIQYQKRPDAPLKTVEVVDMQIAPVASYVTFNVEGGNKAFTSWAMEIADEKGKIQYYGPYTYETVSIPGKTLLGDRTSGDYKVSMIGKTRNGNIIRKEAPLHIVLWTPPTNHEIARFSIIYEFNNSDAIKIYSDYLTNEVIPKIPAGSTVIIHGYTDNIGDEDVNMRLSLARANDVKDILVAGLARANKKVEAIDVFGFGEDEKLSPFNNTYPEERFYNRIVMIDVIPKK